VKPSLFDIRAQFNGLSPVWQARLGILLFGGGAGLFGYEVATGSLTGVLHGRYGASWDRIDEPGAFWFQIAWRVGAAIVCVLFVRRIVARGPKPLFARKMHSPTLIIAVDGPAASGKGTIAARLARVYGLPFLDTGLLYRAVGLSVLDDGRSLDDEAAAEAVARALKAENLSDTDRLTSGEAGEAASRVAGYPGVRAALLEFQRAFAAQPGGAVLDGRDIGTVIAPDAPAKLFITATPEVRAMRRWKQLTGRGDLIAYEDMLADIVRRDERDAGRGAAPMVQADDAVLLDTTEMDIEAAFDAARRIVEAARVRNGL